MPLVINYVKGILAIAHNGNLTNAIELRHELEYTGAIFQTTIDSEGDCISYCQRTSECKEGRRRGEKCDEEDQRCICAGCYLAEKMIGARDPFGFKPLCIGKRENTYFLASESCAVAAVGGEFVRDVEPGEIVSFTKHGMKSDKSMAIDPRSRQDVFLNIFILQEWTV